MPTSAYLSGLKLKNIRQSARTFRQLIPYIYHVLNICTMANQNPRKIMLYMPLTLTPPYKAASEQADAAVPHGIPRRLEQYRFPQRDVPSEK